MKFSVVIVATLLAACIADAAVKPSVNSAASKRRGGSVPRTWLVAETYEGPGYSGSAPTESGTVDEDEATFVAVGEQACEIVTGTSGMATWTFPATNEIWIEFPFQIPDATPTAELYVAYMTGSSGTEINSIRVRTTGVWRTAHNGVLVNSVSAGDLADGTWIRVRAHWKGETSEGAANGIFELWTSPLAVTSWAAATQVINQTNGTGLTVDTFSIRGTPANAMSVYFDDTYVDDEPFSTSP